MFVSGLIALITITMKKYPVLSLFVLSLFIVSHSSAYALIDLNVGGQATSSSSSKVEVSAGANASSSSSGSSSQASSEANAMINTNEAIKISRSSLEANGEASAETMSEAVLTQNDLRAYASTALRGDANLEEMNFTGDKVEVSYKEEGKFLALVPVTMKAKAVAKADGSFDLDYPWYAFLTLDNKDQIETNLKIAIDNTLKARTVGRVQAEGEAESPVFTASESAAVAAEMHAILRSSFSGEGAVN